MTVIVPCDYNQTKAATKAIADYEGPVYLRFGRPSWPIFTKEEDFEMERHNFFQKEMMSAFLPAAIWCGMLSRQEYNCKKRVSVWK